MTPETARKPSQRENRTIILPIEQDEYTPIVSAPPKFRAWIDQHSHLNPELFPETFDQGYKFHDKKTSSKTGVMTRRIELRNGEVWTVHPSFVVPHMTGYTEEVAKALHFRKYGVPYEALTYAFGKDGNYWYRILLCE
jgi:hypothetical protein